LRIVALIDGYRVRIHVTALAPLHTTPNFVPVGREMSRSNLGHGTAAKRVAQEDIKDRALCRVGTLPWAYSIPVTLD
jgi:hypothetical protein